MTKIVKYAPIFSLSAFFILSMYWSFVTPHFSLSKHTISGLVLFLNQNDQTTFNSFFIFISLLFVAFHSHIFSVMKIHPRRHGLLLIPTISLGLLGIFPYNRAPLAHEVISYIMYFGWIFCEIYFSRKLAIGWFSEFTNKVQLFRLGIFLALIVLGVFVSGITEAIYIVLAIVWLTVFNRSLNIAYRQSLTIIASP